MAYYLVKARAKTGTLDSLETLLDSGEIREMRPFGSALDESLRGARVDEHGYATWEENDYCNPPLAMERAAVLDHHFSDIEVEVVKKGAGWERIAHLPSLWEEVLP
jgi:hypothetical protein